MKRRGNAIKRGSAVRRPADESDEWTDEDRRDFQLAAWKRLDEEAPYPWPEAVDDDLTR